MSIFRHDTLGSWTRGGQAIVHNVRMTTQVFYQTLVAGLVIWVGGVIWYALEKSSEYERFVLMKLAQASVMGDSIPGNATPLLFKTPDGRQYWTSPKGLLESGVAHRTLEAFETYLIHGAALSGVFALAMLFWAWFYFTRTGRGLGSNQFLRGARFGTVRQVRRALWRSARGSFEIGGVNVPDAFEPEHILICGAPGTGKTNIIIKMLDGIRQRGKRAIVYDTAGTFVEKFYRPGTDILLNPLDVRSDRWSPWVDVPRDYHYDQIAESTIPDKAGDPFWAKSARGTLVAVMRKLARQQRTLVSILLDTLLRSKLKDLAAFAQGTDAAAFISLEGERTSAGIQAELASVMRSFSYLDDTEDGLSIRDWVANEKDDSWLFITVKADQLPSLRPLITVWLDIAISAIMSLSADRNRRLYCVIDELPSLQKLPSLSDFLARARKYGGCGILGFQSYPQLEATYGIQDAAAITGYCSTWVALRANDTPTAKHVSENLGQVEQVEANEGMSYGVNDMRDGVNLSRMQVTRPLVMHTEVTNLPNLCGYLRFGRNLPVVQFQDSYNRVPSVCVAFEERLSPPARMAIDPLAASEPATQSEPVATRPPAKRRRAHQEEATDELPLAPAVSPAEAQEAPPSDEPVTPSSSGSTGDIEPVIVTPQLTLYGRATAFRLKQHGRRDGDRNAADPA
ncbi:MULTISPECIES: type IV secretion system DNA-binding domain-containing protein [Sphingomonadaceae]|jgi:type IV conjugative transfer system coupling protein TraD|uniref:type IV secretion system DNA-binding domain-containing protein n=1 Tax=Sphingomonadales TaxID=204457 RepID=UPI000DB3E365|nr:MULTISPECIES: type IV secretion system DNA-binding domain-containing protein [Sphingomonadaceae]NLS27196.1 Coupling protein TraD [Sphingomonas sp. S2M10]PZU11363.1 MAG: conjugal transfer protein TraD [Sphingobium sp.]